MKHFFDLTRQTRINVNYGPSISNYGRNVYLLYENQIIKGTLQTWNEHLRNLSKLNRHDWINLLREALDIFKGNVKGFANASDEDEIREGIMMMHMKNLLRETL